MTDQPLTPPEPPDDVAPSPPPPPPPGDWGSGPPIGTGASPTAMGGRVSVAWSITALVACVVSVVGVFLPFVSARGRSIDRDTLNVGIAIPWAYHDRLFVSGLFERWEVAVAFLVLAGAAAVVSLAAGRYRWPAAAGVVCAALAFHLMLSMVQRAEFMVAVRLDEVSYSMGALLTVGGAFLALVSFVVALARRQ